MILKQSPFTLGPWGARAYHTRAAILAQVWTSVQLGIQKKRFMDSLDWVPVLEFLSWQSFGKVASASKEIQSQGSDYAHNYFKDLARTLVTRLGQTIDSEDERIERTRQTELLGKYVLRLDIPVPHVESGR